MAEEVKETRDAAEEAAQTDNQAQANENSAADEKEKAASSSEESADMEADLTEPVSEEETGEEADMETGREEADMETGREEADKEETGEEEADMETGEEEAGQQKNGGKKEGLFKKKKKSKEQEQIEELTDRVKRQMAEFDNFRKRTEKEKTQMFETGAKSIIEKILPVVDNFERGLAALSEEEKAAPFAEGMDKIYKQMMTMLTEAGVTPIEAEGKEFDPNLHNAVMHIDDESLGENVVVQELQKGYMYHDSVVRHSMVQVAN